MATEALARIACEKLAGRPPDPRTKKLLAKGIHFVYGLGVAALYGAVRAGGRLPRRRARHTVRDGLLLGAALWLVGDELAVPLLGLSDKPTSIPADRHARSLVAHVGFGVATAATTRIAEILS
jgi:hypothetical protein